MAGSHGEPAGDSGQSAAEDLAAGLDLMLRAARKALKNIDPGRIEELGKRARHTVEHLDRKKVSEFGRKAAKSLDPRKIEEVAEEAGRELLSVIERVADRVEDILGRPKSSRAPGPADASDADSSATSSPGANEPRAKVRVENSN